MAHGNGSDPSLDEENQVFSRALSYAEGLPIAESGPLAFAGVEAVKYRMQRLVGTSLATVHRRQDDLEKIVVGGNAQLAALVRARFEDGESRVAAVERWKEEEMTRRKRDPEDSIVDVLERLNPEDADRVIASKGRAIDAADGWRKRFEDIEADLHERDIREDQAAKTKAEAAEDADKSFKRKRDMVGFVGGVIAILGAIGGTVAYVLAHYK